TSGIINLFFKKETRVYLCKNQGRKMNYGTDLNILRLPTSRPGEGKKKNKNEPSIVENRDDKSSDNGRNDNNKSQDSDGKKSRVQVRKKNVKEKEDEAPVPPERDMDFMPEEEIDPGLDNVPGNNIVPQINILKKRRVAGQRNPHIVTLEQNVEDIV